MTSKRRFQIVDRGQRAGSRGSAAVAVIFVVLANLTLFGVLAAVLLPRSASDANTGPARGPAVAMALATPSGDAVPAHESMTADALPAPAAALASPSVTPGSPSLVLARSAQRVPRVCPPRDSRRVSIAQQHPPTPRGAVRLVTP